MFRYNYMYNFPLKQSPIFTSDFEEENDMTCIKVKIGSSTSLYQRYEGLNGKPLEVGKYGLKYLC